MASSLSQRLPPELWQLIFDYIEPSDINRFSLASREVRRLCLTPRLWKRFCFSESAWRDSLGKRRRVSGPSSAAQDMANWDPEYPNESVSWHTEYSHRQGPTSINWLQMPRGHSDAMVEARGLALYHDAASTLALSPLEDGSLCIWDVRGTRAKQGAILARSESGLLTMQHLQAGINDAISVDSSSHRAYIAAQNHIMEIDVSCLQVVGQKSFDCPITAISAIQPGVPLTVGTPSGLYLYDPRDRPRAPGSLLERLDQCPCELNTTWGPMLQTPLSILHLPCPNSPSLVTNDIFVAGRMPFILHCDRRNLAAIVEPIYSGADIKSITAIACRFPTVESGKRRMGQLTVSQAAEIKHSCHGQTLIAGGSYSSKGSLEMYGLGQDARRTADAGLINRQNAAPATILSVINHGTKIACSDGAGFVRWFERDGTTEIRRVQISSHGFGETDSLFMSSRLASDDMALKMLSTGLHQVCDELLSDNIVFWTGERLGMVGFTRQPLFCDLEARSQEESAEQERSRAYTSAMRRALGREADAARFVHMLQR